MKNRTKNIIIVILCVVIAGAVALSVWRIAAGRTSDQPNPNVTLVTTPEQTGFEAHPEWTIAGTQSVDYGENLALGKPVTEDGHTDVYGCVNLTDGDRLTYWEGLSGQYPNQVTIDLEQVTVMGGAQILLNPNAIWGARTQEVEVQVSDDGENFVTVFEKATLSFDPQANNSAYLEFAPSVSGRYVRFLFYSNTGAGGGQAAEIEIYAP